MNDTIMNSPMAMVERYYTDYGCRARELKEEGRRVIGYLCAFTPVEIITAAGCIPFRIKGDVHEPVTKADTLMETIVCPLVRSCFDLSLKGKYDFIDGLIIPHACDSINRTYDVWKTSLGLPYTHLVNLPHAIDDSSVEFFRHDLETFRTSLGNFTGREITDEALREAIESHNMLRRLVKDLYLLRKDDPPLISGSLLTKVLLAAVSIPVNEAVTLLEGVLEEVKTGAFAAREKKSARIMVVGAEIDDTALIDIIEASGAEVTADDLCPGAREFRSPVPVTGIPTAGLAERYLRDVKCGRTWREVKGSYEESLDDRFGHIIADAQKYKADGVILFMYKYCDPFGFEVPAMKSYIESHGIPVLYLEDEYAMSTAGRLTTRIQAFLEMIA